MKGKRLFFVFVLTAVVISGQVLPYTVFSVAELQQQVVQTEVSDTEENEPTTHTTTLGAACEAVLPILKLQVAAYFYLVRELVLLCEIEQKSEFPLPAYTNDFFRTLFRHIIAPNAP